MNSTATPEFRHRLLFGIIAGSLLVLASAYLTSRYYYHSVSSDISRFMKNFKETQHGYVASIPIYEDFATPAMEQKLRSYLFPHHYAEAQKSGVRVEDEGSIRNLAGAGALVRLNQGSGTLYYFYNVRDAYRYLTPTAAEGLGKIARRFQQNISSRKALPPVKIAVSSVLRPESYQNNLRGRNINATMVSTHSYGVSFDIFYDDYFVSIPHQDGDNMISRAVIALLRPSLGYLLGDALKSQFRSILMETLLQLQDEGALYAILERNQHCYHVTIPGPAAPGSDNRK